MPLDDETGETGRCSRCGSRSWNDTEDGLCHGCAIDFEFEQHIKPKPIEGIGGRLTTAQPTKKCPSCGLSCVHPSYDGNTIRCLLCDYVGEPEYIDGGPWLDEEFRRVPHGIAMAYLQTTKGIGDRDIEMIARCRRCKSQNVVVVTVVNHHTDPEIETVSCAECGYRAAPFWDKPSHLMNNDGEMVGESLGGAYTEVATIKHGHFYCPCGTDESLDFAKPIEGIGGRNTAFEFGCTDEEGQDYAACPKCGRVISRSHPYEVVGRITSGLIESMDSSSLGGGGVADLRSEPIPQSVPETSEERDEEDDMAPEEEARRDAILDPDHIHMKADMWGTIPDSGLPSSVGSIGQMPVRLEHKLAKDHPDHKQCACGRYTLWIGAPARRGDPVKCEMCKGYLEPLGPMMGIGNREIPPKCPECGSNDIAKDQGFSQQWWQSDEEFDGSYDCLNCFFSSDDRQVFFLQSRSVDESKFYEKGIGDRQIETDFKIVAPSKEEGLKRAWDMFRSIQGRQIEVLELAAFIGDDSCRYGTTPDDPFIVTVRDMTVEMESDHDQDFSVSDFCIDVALAYHPLVPISARSFWIDGPEVYYPKAKPVTESVELTCSECGNATGDDGLCTDYTCLGSDDTSEVGDMTPVDPDIPQGYDHHLDPDAPTNTMWKGLGDETPDYRI